MRISDWSSDVCSSDLCMPRRMGTRRRSTTILRMPRLPITPRKLCRVCLNSAISGDRKSVVKGKSVSVRVDLGGRRIIKKQIDDNQSRELLWSHQNQLSPSEL